MKALYGIFGFPVAHSRSPQMHNAAFAELGIDAVYVPFEVAPERLADAVAAVRVLGVRGLNVTLPHKAEVMALLDEVEPGARAIGAVNTIAREGERLIGLNTDAEGLARSLREAGTALEGARVVVLGGSGAARAAAVGLGAHAQHVTVATRRPEQAAALCAAVEPALTCPIDSCGMDAALERALSGCTLLIQATSATLGEGEGPERFAASLPIDALPGDATVCDLGYKPLETTVMRAAAARGLATVDGLGMLLHQGALAFERWTGEAAPIAVMRQALIG
ncbi:MAG: shikimate dehydrogenase [Myxococcales bacterium]|nr:shikimate dehydrogenase [Myxococcales bacterium]